MDINEKMAEIKDLAATMNLDGYETNYDALTAEIEERNKSIRRQAILERFPEIKDNTKAIEAIDWRLDYFLGYLDRITSESPFEN